LNMASTASGTFAFTKFKKLPLEIRNIVRLKYSHADLWPMCLPIWSCHHEKRSQGHWFRSFDLPKLGMLTWRSSDVAIYPPAPCHGTRMNFRGEWIVITEQQPPLHSEYIKNHATKLGTFNNGINILYLNTPWLVGNRLDTTLHQLIPVKTLAYHIALLTTHLPGTTLDTPRLLLSRRPTQWREIIVSE
jgi:hypothetical protein